RRVVLEHGAVQLRLQQQREDELDRCRAAFVRQLGQRPPRRVLVRRRGVPDRDSLPPAHTEPLLPCRQPVLHADAGALPVARAPPMTASRTELCPIDGTSVVAGPVLSSAARYSAKVDHGHASGPPPSSPRRYACRSPRRSGATGAGARPSGLISSVVKPWAIF